MNHTQETLLPITTCIFYSQNELCFSVKLNELDEISRQNIRHDKQQLIFDIQQRSEIII